jgi:hypothetical protein
MDAKGFILLPFPNLMVGDTHDGHKWLFISPHSKRMSQCIRKYTTTKMHRSSHGINLELVLNFKPIYFFPSVTLD